MARQRARIAQCGAARGAAVAERNVDGRRFRSAGRDARACRFRRRTRPRRDRSRAGTQRRRAGAGRGGVGPIASGVVPAA
ncbi:MAG TPA: hypothetical protein VJ806_02000 [Luteimonas sp.]|nr:hypothetical protein [Luteimonas sp.]